MDEDKDIPEERPFVVSKPAEDEQPDLRKLSKEEQTQILEDHKKWLGSERMNGKADFQYTDLAGKSGDRSYFKEKDLREAKFRGADIQHGIFEKAKLQSTDFAGTILIKANFKNADLSKADLRKADLTTAELQKAELREANLEKAILINAHLEETKCQDANFRKAQLANARLNEAKMTRANLQKADLSYVDGMDKAELQYADLSGAIGLLGYEFARNNITGTKLPDNIKEFKTLDVVEETSKNARKIFFAMLLGCVNHE